MVKSLFTGVTGLKAHQQRMDMIGNNIANVNTIGYKTDVMTFADVYYQTKRSPSAPTATLGGINPRQVGYGVKVSSVEANLSQSGYNYTDNKTDIALDGKGFFQLMDGAGNKFYTRAGHFKFDSAGYLVNDDGYHVLGVSGECDGVSGSSDVIRAVIPETQNHVSSQTKLVNGTNVTVSVSAPSKYTNMSVTFAQSDHPYATYANGLLTIFFDKEAQYDSQDDFDREIQKAIAAGGVNLPDDVEVTMSFDPIPDQIESVAAKNKVDDYKFAQTQSTCRFHIYKPAADGNGKEHAYIDFSVSDNTNKDSITLKKSTSGKVEVEYANGAWTIKIDDETTAADINKALKDYLSEDEHAYYPQLSCTGMQIPSAFKRADAIDAFTGTAPADTTIKADDGTTVFTNKNVTDMYGAVRGKATGMFDLGVKEPGSYANEYRIQFASKSGYGNTSAVWEENTLTINVCADTTLADVNRAIKKAANGDDKRMITFYDINGLDYGTPIITDDPDVTDGKIIEYPMGYTAKATATTTGTPPATTTTLGAVTWTDRYGRDVTAADVATALGVTEADLAAAGDDVSALPPISKTAADDPDKFETVWNVATREQFFGTNPSINPADGDDSFFTKTAKALSTFNLTDGRIGSEQTMDEFTDYMIGSDGVIIGLHPVYGTMVLGRVDIATFDNPNGLEKVGGTNFRETVASGAPSVKKPGEDGAAAIVPNALEMSNVDLAEEFTNMIATQRGYQANSRVVTVSDTMIEELLSLKR